MLRTRVKICGITCLPDALAAVAAGADAIGLVFHPASFRAVSIDSARQIIAALPPFVSTVGLFVDDTIPEIKTTAEALHLTAIQLHGQETPQIVPSPSLPLRVIKAIHVTPNQLAQTLAPWRDALAAGLPNLVGLVLETGGGSTTGGTGIENDWQQIADLQSRGGFAALPPIIAAGGLRPDYVAHFIEASAPPTPLNVSSGVEQTRGRKDPVLIHQFIQSVRQADTSRKR